MVRAAVGAVIGAVVVYLHIENAPWLTREHLASSYKKEVGAAVGAAVGAMVVYLSSNRKCSLVY